jgi:lysophospholipid acyltransferase (LPLAT)-like uncharacterized protein
LGKADKNIYVNIFALVANNITFSHHQCKRSFVKKENPENPDKSFQLSDLSEYPWKKRLLVRAIARTAYFLIGLTARTVPFESEGEEHYENLLKQDIKPIWVLWHDRLFLSTWYLRKRKIVAMTSQSFDGEYIARLIQLQGNGAVRGSSTRGGVKGLVEMIRLAKRGIAMCFIVDGPKGPPYVAKDGAVALAKKAGMPLLPLHIEVKHFRENSSWDRMQVPRPFTRGKVFLGDPIFVSADDEIEVKRQELQDALDALVKAGKKWRTEEK